MKFYFLLWGLCLFPLVTVQAQDEQNIKVAVENIPFFNAEKSASGLYVLMFLGTDCPISQKYGNTLRELPETYSDITFYGIVPHHFSEKEMIQYKKEYNLPFSMYRDEHNKVAKICKATITPEVFLIDGDGNVYYDGAIDNWFYALGKSRFQPTQFYLKEAIEEVQNLQPVSVPHADAVGCMIEMKH